MVAVEELKESQNSQVATVCPAFSDGCPYASSDQITEWLSARRDDAITSCPAFKAGCPFNAVQDLPSLCTELQKLPASHGGPDSAPPSLAHSALLGMLQAVHQASQRVKETVGSECPVFQAACPFKSCVTSSGIPLVQELETRAWGLMIGDSMGEEVLDGDRDAATAGDENALPGVSDTPTATAEGLARMLKEGTAEAHKAAETVHFVKEFIRGRVAREVYAQFVVNLYHIYTALEAALDECADHPLVEPLYFPDELRRGPQLRKDAEYFCGPDWETTWTPSRVTLAYVERIREIPREAPELIVPHAYTRYLGDLSGGQLLRRAAVRGLKLPDDGSGVCFYTFRRIPDGKGFKNMYRARLDNLEADRSCADAMVVEANLAFSFNTRIFQELDVLAGYDPMEMPEVPKQPPKSAAPAAAGRAPTATPGLAACPFAALAASGVPMPADHPALAPAQTPQKQANESSPPTEPVRTTGTHFRRDHLPNWATWALVVAVIAVLLGLVTRLPGEL